MNGLDAVEAIAIDLGCPAKRDAPMREYTSFRTGGPADLLVEPQEEGQLAQILRCCNAQGLQPVILGNGSNVLVADEGIRGVVLCLVPGLRFAARAGWYDHLRGGRQHESPVPVRFGERFDRL